jgi:hypothetical protein
MKLGARLRGHDGFAVLTFHLTVAVPGRPTGCVKRTKMLFRWDGAETVSKEDDDVSDSRLRSFQTRGDFFRLAENSQDVSAENFVDGFSFVASIQQFLSDSWVR